MIQFLQEIMGPVLEYYLSVGVNTQQISVLALANTTLFTAIPQLSASQIFFVQ